MEPDSPLQTQLLKRSTRRVVWNSDEDELEGRGDKGTHSGCYADTTCPCSSQMPGAVNLEAAGEQQSGLTVQSSLAQHDTVATSPVEREQLDSPSHDETWETVSDVASEEGVVITLTHGEDTVWISDSESTHSDTSTPACKRGRHSSPVTSTQPDVITQQAVEEIIKFGYHPWIKKHKQRKQERVVKEPSMHILADARLSNWPHHDRLCVVDYHPGWSLKKWVTSLRAEITRIRCNTVVLYLKKTQEYNEVPWLKNALQMICKVIRQHRRGARIFICNSLPKTACSPVATPLVEIHFTLLQAVHSVNRALYKVHFLSIYEHFISRKGKLIKPAHVYFQEDQEMTKYGCLVVRECLLREAGLRGYWF